MSDCHCSVSVPIIGYHRSGLKEKFGIPRQPNLVSIISYIEMNTPYDTIEAFEGLDNFSHLWITWYAHHNHLNAKVKDHPFKPKVRPPRLGGNAKLGVFATRSTYRPSQLGMSVVQFLGVESLDSGLRVYLLGSDMVDGTPIVDIKPYLAYSDVVEEAKTGYASNKPDSKIVEVSEPALQQFNSLISDDDRFDIDSKNEISYKNGKENVNFANETASRIKDNFEKYLQFDKLLTDQLIPADFDIIRQLISQDPRPAYQKNTLDRIYYMRYKNYDIGFKLIEAEQNYHLKPTDLSGSNEYDNQLIADQLIQNDLRNENLTDEDLNSDSNTQNIAGDNGTTDQKLSNKITTVSSKVSHTLRKGSNKNFSAKDQEYKFLIVSIHSIDA